MKAVIHAKAILPDGRGDFCIREEQAIIFDERIRAVMPMDEWNDRGCEVLDAQGRYLSPGFINMHVHGCGGKDTMDENGDALSEMCRVQAQMGVTSFLPTTMTYDVPRIKRAFQRIRRAMEEKPEGARILGCHMEGPYISPVKVGAQDPKYIRKADYGDIAGFEDVVRIITLAPEELEDWDFVRQCKEKGILLSIGHTSADYGQAVAAVRDHGMGRFTHLFNAMTGFQHRSPGVVGAALDTKADCELIADNVHSHPMAQRLVYRAKGGKHIILVTDSLRACGVGDGPSELGGQKVLVKGELATLENGTIAGSVLRMNRAVAIFRENTGAPLPRVIEMVSKTPSEELGMYEDMGSIETGKRADLVIFDENLEIFATVVSGGVVFSSFL